ncbi:developmental regulator FlbA [Colletotrichum tofieldiae]|nr:developmental regulator FlbA [Colletotrichum tofieldiae]
MSPDFMTETDTLQRNTVGDAEQEPRRASIQPANLDSGTWNSPQLATLTIAPLRIRKGVDQSQAPSFEEPYPNAWIPTNQRLQGDQQAGQTKPNLHGPRPQPQSDRRANESHAIRVVSESPPRNNAISVQPAQAEVLDHYPAPVPAPPPPSLPARRFEDIDHPGVQRASQTSNVFRATADEIRKYVSGEKINTDPATNFVLLPRYIFTHSQVVDLERGNAKLFEVSFKETDCGKSSEPRGGFQYKYDSGIIVEDPNEERRSSTPSSCWSSWSSRSGTPPTSIRLE